MHDDLRRYATDLAGVIQAMPFEQLAEVAEMLLQCRERGATIFTLGNGGSAATASHIACDLAKNTRAPGLTPFRVVALTDNVPLITAWGNDTSYDRIFAEQLMPLVRSGDLVLIITASGNSPNVLVAADAAREAGATVVALTGRTGGRVADLAHLTIRIPSDSMEQVEDAHLIIGHNLCTTLRNRMKASVAEATIT